MITFLTVFLGLMTGVEPVELAVGGGVVAVELRLDGHGVARLQKPPEEASSEEPWTLVCDFGPELAPHELVAVGFDAEGEEVARTVQWVNLPRPRSEVELVLAGTTDRPGVRLVWHSVDGGRPDAWRVTFDGAALVVEDPSYIELPAYDAMQIHLLQVELRFGHSFAHAERTVGGVAAEEVGSELTAFPVAVRAGKVPLPAEMAGWFQKDGVPLKVVAVDRSGADIVLVQEASTKLWGELRRLRLEVLSGTSRGPMSALRTSGLKHGDRLRVLLPVSAAALTGRPADGAVPDLFPISPDFEELRLAELRKSPRSTGQVRREVAGPAAEGILATLPYPPEGPIEDVPRRLADAVAVAGLAASAGRRPRAVVLIHNGETPDESVHDPVTVRRYLDRLQVPLLVWSPEHPPDAGWDEVQNISSRHELVRAMGDLRTLLDRQVVVWLEGRHLPQEVELSPAGAARLDLVTGSLPDADQGEEDFEEWVASVEPDAALPPADTASAEEVVAQEGPELHIAETLEVRLVNVEAVVTDREGRRVTDLRKDDFELYEDGQRREIAHFRPPEVKALPASPETPPGAGESRLVVFLDSAHLPSAQRKKIVRELAEVLQEKPSSTQVMLVTYDGGVEVRLPFTATASQIDASLAEIEGEAGGRGVRRSERAALANEMAQVQRALDTGDADARSQAEGLRDSVVLQLRQLAEVERHEIRSTLGVLGQVVAGLGGVVGRKLLLYVGDGLELEPLGELYEEATRTLGLGGPELARLENEARAMSTYDDFDRLSRQANANGVSFHTLTPRRRGGSDLAERATQGSVGFQGRMASTRQALVEGAVCLLSDDTGGRCQAGGSDTRQALAETVEDLSSVYSLAFTPPHESDGKLHRIEVKVRPGLEVRHRTAYADKVRAERAEDWLAAALLFGAEDDALGLQLVVGEPKPLAQEGQFLLELEARVPVQRLGLLPLAEDEAGRLGARARLLVQVMDADHRFSGVQESPIAFQVRPERLAEEPPLVYAHKVHLTLTSGRFKLALVLWDEIGGVGSYLSRTVDIGASR